MASTKDLRPTVSTPVSSILVGREKLLLVDVDFTVAANQIKTSETLSLLDIPANHVVYGAFIKVNTADEDVTDVDLGITTNGATSAGLIDGATLASTGYKVGAGTYMVNSAATQLVLTMKNDDGGEPAGDVTINQAKVTIGVWIVPATA